MTTEPATRALRDIPVPRDERFFEDYTPGLVCEYGDVVVDETEVLEFAHRYDPQPMHIDRAAADAGPHRGLIASGWHTAGIVMRLMVDHFLSQRAGLASPGVDDLRWSAPVRPGDRLRARIEITEARLSRSKPDRGIVRTSCQLLNQDGVVVLSMAPVSIVLRRDR